MIAKMKSVKIYGYLENLDQFIKKCFEQKCFHPESPNSQLDSSSKFVNLTDKNPYTDLLNKLIDISDNLGIKVTENISEMNTEPLSVNEVQINIAEISQNLNSLSEKRRLLNQEIEERNNVIKQLEHIEKLNISFDEIFRSQILKVRFGKLPVDSYGKLEYFDDRLFVFITLDKNDEYYWGVYFTVEGYDTEIDTIFSSLYFERIRVPDFIHGTPESAKQQINKELNDLKQQLSEVDHSFKDLKSDNSITFCYYYKELKFLADSFETRKYVLVKNEMFYISGYVPEKNIKDFSNSIKKISGIIMEEFKPNSDSSSFIPTKLRNNWFVKPFEMFVDMYGLPSYNDIDPTPFVAYTYLFLFGMMFGDLGQGISISIIGYMLYKIKKMNLGKIMIRLGIFSSAFGLLYGSVFGYEHLLNTFYEKLFGLKEKPFEVLSPLNTNTIIVGAVGIGAAIILMSMMINIIIGLKKRDFSRAIFGQNGLAGLLFYGFLITAAVSTLYGGPNLFTAPYLLLFVALPLTMMFFKEPISHLLKKTNHRLFEEGIGSFFIEGFFELFDILLSFITNTMSFLRVGGFILSHAGMMMVVMTLSEMAGSGASPIVIIIGNLFVMAMEGLIVGIQVLRLEFYEMFSRYFDGDGTPFQPVGVITE